MAVDTGTATYGCVDVVTAGSGGRMYELTSTRPLPTLDIPITLALRWFGSRTNAFLVDGYVAHRVAFTWVSTAAKIIALVAWYAPWRYVAIVPVLVCCLPKLVCTVLLLSVPILQILVQQYEFWFATTLNVIACALFSHQIGFNTNLGYAGLASLSIQVTILADADIYTLSETVRGGVLSSIYAVALAVFALHQSSNISSLLSPAQIKWRQAQLNLEDECRSDLGDLRHQQDVQETRSAPHTRQGPPSASARIEDDGGNNGIGPSSRRKSSVLSSARFDFRVRSQAFRFVDSRDTLFPRLCVGHKLSRARFVVLTSCGVLGLCLAGITLFLIVIVDFRLESVLYPCAVLSLVLTATYCLAHAVHYQRDILKLIVHNFDFWFLSMQFISATVCLADLLQWDYRCLCIISWSLWFHWVLLVDALVTTHARKLHFHKRHAAPVLLAVLFGILVLAYSLAIDAPDILQDRAIKLSSLHNEITLSMSTGTFMVYRLGTMRLWTVRLVSRLAQYPDDKLIFLQGAVEYRNPFFVKITDSPTIGDTNS